MLKLNASRGKKSMVRYITENDEQQKRTVICEARGIRLKLEHLEMAFMTVFWVFLRDRIYSTKRKLRVWKMTFPLL